DALAPRAEVLADEGLGKAEPIREDDCFLVLFEQVGVVALGVVERHREHAEPDGHGKLLSISVRLPHLPVRLGGRRNDIQFGHLSKRSPTMAVSETYEKGREVRRQLLGDAYVERVNQTAYNDPI